MRFNLESSSILQMLLCLRFFSDQSLISITDSVSRTGEVILPDFSWSIDCNIILIQFLTENLSNLYNDGVS